MTTDNIVITTLQAKEKEMEAQLLELRSFIQSLISKGGRAIVEKDTTIVAQKATEKRKYNTAGRRRKSEGQAIDPIAAKMREYGKFLHRVQIAEITGIEADKLSSILSIAAKNGKHNLVNYVPGKSKNQTVWGFKDWLDLDDKPEQKHMYDEDFVSKRK